MDENNSIYTSEEQKQLDTIKKVRFDIIDVMTKEGPPDAVGEIRVLNEVLNSADKMIVDTATIRTKQEAVNTNGAAVEMVVELLRQSRANKQEFDKEGNVPTILANVKQIALVDGEGDITPEPLVPDDFVPPSFDASRVED